MFSWFKKNKKNKLDNDEENNYIISVKTYDEIAGCVINDLNEEGKNKNGTYFEHEGCSADGYNR